MRSLPADVDQLHQAGVHVLVCLLNDAELRALGIKSGDYYREEVGKKMEAVQFPIVEGHAAVIQLAAALAIAPALLRAELAGAAIGWLQAAQGDQSGMVAAHRLLDGVVEAVEAGQTAVLHCRGGVGRAGMLAACALLRFGEAQKAKEAIALVRR
eukprot:SAG22_NODE_69_length_22779_cov_71.088139_12_plen_155_part_00